MTLALDRLTGRATTKTGDILMRWAANSMRTGTLDVTWPDGKRTSHGGAEPGPHTAARIYDEAFFGKVLRGGEVGFGEAYMDGLWDTDDLTALLTLGILNRKHASPVLAKINDLSRWPNRRLHLRRRNTLDGSRKNIEAHYDLSNELFALFLDETMGYSSAVYATPDQDLAEAQRTKYDLLCRKAALSASDHVLEIGCGWGGFAMYAAQTYGCRVTAVTISKEQMELAQRRVAEAGLEGLIEVRLSDYRQIEGTYDKIVSIEMFEAVGAEYFEAFFKACDALLKPRGRMVMQTISVPDRTFASLRDGVNWMQKYIFPGGMLPSLAQLDRAIARTKLVISGVEDIAEHYVLTLREWRRRFMLRQEEVFALGFDRRFVRMWEYYLCAAEAGFATRSTGDLQVVFDKA